MRVLHFFKTYYPDSFGGVERTIHAIAKGSATRGINSCVLSLSRVASDRTCEIGGHTAYKAQLDFELASTSFSRDVFAKFSKLSSEVDLIHYHFPWPFMDMVHLLTSPHRPTVVTYHSDIVKQRLLLPFYRPIMHRFLSRVDRIVATSENYLKSSPVLQRYASKTIVIPIGLDCADYPSPPSALTHSWGARFPRPFFLFVGVLRYYKGLHNLIDAARDVEADILIVGEGPLQTELQLQSQRLGLSNVHFLGALSDLDKAALLELSTAFVFPSHLRSEAYGLSLVEAAMFGKPMISCEIGTGTSFINRDGQTGLVVPINNPSALARAMTTLLQDAITTKRYGMNALARYQAELTADLMVDRYCKLYRELLPDQRKDD